MSNPHEELIKGLSGAIVACGKISAAIIPIMEITAKKELRLTGAAQGMEVTEKGETLVPAIALMTNALMIAERAGVDPKMVLEVAEVVKETLQREDKESEEDLKRKVKQSLRGKVAAEGKGFLSDEELQKMFNAIGGDS